MSSMFDSILGMVTPEIKQSLAARLGEPPQAVQRGLGTATAATITGMANSAGSSSFTDQILQMATRAGGQNVLGNLSSIASGGPTGAVEELVGKFLSLVFGTQQTQVANLVSQQSGVSAAAGTGILKMAAPLVLGYLAKMQGAGTLSAGTLASTLRSEASNLTSYVPSGFFRSPAATVTESATRAANLTEPSRPIPPARPVAAGYPRWAVPAAIIAALLLGWLAFSSVHRARQPRVAQTTTSETGTLNSTTTTYHPEGATVTTTGTPAAWASLGTPVNVQLPDGTSIMAPAQGVEVRLVTYLNSSATPVQEVTWFDFDRLLFDTDKTTLQPASFEQLNNVAAILKAYPTVKIRLGGYTDNTGDPATNMQLSAGRADTVMAELSQRGIDPSRMSAKGYGEENPVADNSTEQGRQQNRRVSIRVAEK